MVWGLMPWSVSTVDDALLLDFVEQAGTTFPVMFDSDGTYYLYDQVGASAPFPLDIIVDQQGVVRYTATYYDPDEIEAVIESLRVE